MDVIIRLLQDGIALQGLQGIALSSLWTVGEEHSICEPHQLLPTESSGGERREICHHMREILWRQLVALPQIECYLLPESSPDNPQPAPSSSKWRETMQVTVQGVVTRSVQARRRVRLPMAQLPAAVARQSGGDQATNGISTDQGLLLDYGRCTSVAERLYLVCAARQRAVALGADLAFHELDEFPGQMLSQRDMQKMNEKATGGGTGRPLTYCVLEEVGRRRYGGAVQRDLALVLNVHSKHVFTALKWLEDRKRIVYCNPSLPSKAKAVHILLFRYRDRWLQHNPVVTRACRKAHMASEIQNLNAKEFRQYCNRREQLRCEATTARLEVGRDLWRVRFDTLHRVSAQDQIFQLIDARREKGIFAPELAARLGLNYKLVLGVLDRLRKAGLVVAVADTLSKSVSFRFFLAKHFAVDGLGTGLGARALLLHPTTRQKVKRGISSNGGQLQPTQRTAKAASSGNANMGGGAEAGVARTPVLGKHRKVTSIRFQQRGQRLRHMLEKTPLLSSLEVRRRLWLMEQTPKEENDETDKLAKGKHGGQTLRSNRVSKEGKEIDRKQAKKLFKHLSDQKLIQIIVVGVDGVKGNVVEKTILASPALDTRTPQVREQVLSLARDSASREMTGSSGLLKQANVESSKHTEQAGGSVFRFENIPHSRHFVEEAEDEFSSLARRQQADSQKMERDQEHGPALRGSPGQGKEVDFPMLDNVSSHTESMGHSRVNRSVGGNLQHPKLWHSNGALVDAEVPAFNTALQQMPSSFAPAAPATPLEDAFLARMQASSGAAAPDPIARLPLVTVTTSLVQTLQPRQEHEAGERTELGPHGVRNAWQEFSQCLPLLHGFLRPIMARSRLLHRFFFKWQRALSPEAGALGAGKSFSVGDLLVNMPVRLFLMVIGCADPYGLLYRTHAPAQASMDSTVHSPPLGANVASKISASDTVTIDALARTSAAGSVEKASDDSFAALQKLESGNQLSAAQQWELAVLPLSKVPLHMRPRVQAALKDRCGCLATALNMLARLGLLQGVQTRQTRVTPRSIGDAKNAVSVNKKATWHAQLRAVLPAQTFIVSSSTNMAGVIHSLNSLEQQDKYWERLQSLAGAVWKERDGCVLGEADQSELGQVSKFALLKQFPISLHSVMYERFSWQVGDPLTKKQAGILENWTGEPPFRAWNVRRFDSVTWKARVTVARACCHLARRSPFARRAQDLCAVWQEATKEDGGATGLARKRARGGGIAGLFTSVHEARGASTRRNRQRGSGTRAQREGPRKAAKRRRQKTKDETTQSRVGGESVGNGTRRHAPGYWASVKRRRLRALRGEESETSSDAPEMVGDVGAARRRSGGSRADKGRRKWAKIQSGDVEEEDEGVVLVDGKLVSLMPEEDQDEEAEEEAEEAAAAAVAAAVEVAGAAGEVAEQPGRRGRETRERWRVWELAALQSSAEDYARLLASSQTEARAEGQAGEEQQQESKSRSASGGEVGSLPHLIRHLMRQVPSRSYVQIRARLSLMRRWHASGRRVDLFSEKMQAVVAAASQLAAGSKPTMGGLSCQHLEIACSVPGRSMQREAALAKLMVVLREPEESYDAASAGKLLGGCAEGDLEAVVKALLKDRWVVRVKSGYKTRRSYALSHLAKRVVFPFRNPALPLEATLSARRFLERVRRQAWRDAEGSLDSNQSSLPGLLEPQSRPSTGSLFFSHSLLTQQGFRSRKMGRAVVGTASEVSGAVVGDSGLVPLADLEAVDRAQVMDGEPDRGGEVCAALEGAVGGELRLRPVLYPRLAGDADVVQVEVAVEPQRLPLLARPGSHFAKVGGPWEGLYAAPATSAVQPQPAQLPAELPPLSPALGPLQLSLQNLPVLDDGIQVPFLPPLYSAHEKEGIGNIEEQLDGRQAGSQDSHAVGEGVQDESKKETEQEVMKQLSCLIENALVLAGKEGQLVDDLEWQRWNVYGEGPLQEALREIERGSKVGLDWLARARQHLLNNGCVKESHTFLGLRLLHSSHADDWYFPLDNSSQGTSSSSSRVRERVQVTPWHRLDGSPNPAMSTAILHALLAAIVHSPGLPLPRLARQFASLRPSHLEQMLLLLEADRKIKRRTHFLSRPSLFTEPTHLGPIGNAATETFLFPVSLGL